MRIKYFEDTDTALLEIGNSSIAETLELSEDVTLDFDGDVHIVLITIEHASLRGDLSEISFQRLGSASPKASEARPSPARVSQPSLSPVS